MSRIFLPVLSLVSALNAAPVRETGFYLRKVPDNPLSADVLSACQDDRGFLWLGTARGVIRYDGNRYRTFLSPVYDSVPAVRNFVRKVFCDSRGRVWIGGEGAAVYEPETDCFYASRLQSENLNVNFFIELSSGKILAGTSGGLAVAESGDRNFRFPTSAEVARLCEDNLRFAARDSWGNWWILGQNWFHRLVYTVDGTGEGGFRTDSYPRRIGDAGGMCMDGENFLWYCEGETLFRVKLPPEGAPDFPGETIHRGEEGKSLFYDPEENAVWMGVRYRELFRYGLGKAGSILACDRFPLDRNGESGPANFITSMAEDRSGDLWMTSRNGLFLWDRTRSAEFRHLGEGPDALSHRVVSAVYEDRNGTLWLGTDGGLNRADFIERQPRVTHYTDDHDGRTVRNNRIKAVIEGPDGMLWAGSQFGISRFDPRTGKFTAFPEADEFIRRHRCALAKSFCRDRNGNVWVGFLYGGIAFYDAARKKFFPAVSGEKNFYRSDVWNIAEAVDGSVWFGTKKDGLFRIRTDADGRVKEMENHTSFSTGLPADWITALHCDASGTVWIGTSAGFCRYAPGKSRAEAIPLLAPGEETYVCGISEDRAGNLWVGSLQGVYRYEKRGGDTRFYGFGSDAVARVEYTYGSCTGKDGRIYLGGIDGLTWFDPSRIPGDTVRTEVFVTEFRTGNREMIPGDGRLKAGLNAGGGVVLDRDENRFSVEFSVPELAHPDYIRYAYRLDGADRDWNYVDWNRAFASYSGLSPGEYVLRLKATDVSGAWSGRERRIPLRILPPWYRTRAAYGLYGLFAVAMVSGTVLILTARQRYRHAIRINGVKERFFFYMTQGFRTPLSLIRLPLQLLQEEDPRLLPAERRYLQEVMERHVRRMTVLIRQLTRLRQIERRALPLFPVETDIVSFLQEIVDSFGVWFDVRGVRLCFVTDVPAFRMVFDAEKVETVLSQLLSNAGRFTASGGEVSVRCCHDRERGRFEVSVADSGPGLPEGYRGDIFGHFWEAPCSGASDGATEVGLSLIRELVELQGGKVSFHTPEGGGTEFSFFLPTEKTHFRKCAIDTPVEGVHPRETDLYVGADRSVKETFPDVENREGPVVFVVSESADAGILLGCVLREYRIRVFSAFEGAQEAAAREHPALVICDRGRCREGMTDFCRMLKGNKVTASIPVLMLTPDDSQEEGIRGYEAGADAVLEKPFDPAFFRVRVAQLLHSRRKLQEKIRLDMLTFPEGERIPSEDERFMERVMAVVNANISNERFSLAEFAGAMHMSRTVLHSRLRALTGCSPIGFLRKARLRKAARLLAGDAYNVTQVSYMVGFSDPRHFSTCFRKQFGASPREWCRQHRNGKDENIHVQEND